MCDDIGNVQLKARLFAAGATQTNKQLNKDNKVNWQEADHFAIQ